MRVACQCLENRTASEAIHDSGRSLQQARSGNAQPRCGGRRKHLCQDLPAGTWVSPLAALSMRLRQLHGHPRQPAPGKALRLHLTEQHAAVRSALQQGGNPSLTAEFLLDKKELAKITNLQ